MSGMGASEEVTGEAVTNFANEFYALAKRGGPSAVHGMFYAAMMLTMPLSDDDIVRTVSEAREKIRKSSVRGRAH